MLSHVMGLVDFWVEIGYDNVNYLFTDQSCPRRQGEMGQAKGRYPKKHIG